MTPMSSPMSAGARGGKAPTPVEEESESDGPDEPEEEAAAVVAADPHAAAAIAIPAQVSLPRLKDARGNEQPPVLVPADALGNLLAGTYSAGTCTQ